VTAGAIDELLKGDYPLSDSVKRSLGSNYLLRKKLDMMDDGLGLQSWLKAETKTTWNSNHPEPIEFYHRSPIEVAKWLLMQPYLEDYQTYNPTMRYVNEERHYSDMFEAKYMWDVQVRTTNHLNYVILITPMSSVLLIQGQLSYHSSSYPTVPT
jgi:hypothetical protein